MPATPYGAPRNASFAPPRQPAGAYPRYAVKTVEHSRAAGFTRIPSIP